MSGSALEGVNPFKGKQIDALKANLRVCAFMLDDEGYAVTDYKIIRWNLGSGMVTIVAKSVGELDIDRYKDTSR